MNISILLCHWAMNDSRSVLMRECVESIIETAPESEIIVTDNGGSLADSTFLLNLCEEKKIACYIRNRNNMSYAFAWNHAAKIASGEYLVFTSNDIVFQKGWLACIDFLEAHPGKLLATPLWIDHTH